ncbi:MAG: FHA domain-containing protein [Deltaproteobacteria bacterium]|nr:FHA domain-containing protein [Deltaproteobacteria bacterium]
MEMSASILARDPGPFLYDMMLAKFYSVRDQHVIGRTSGDLNFPQDGRLSRQHFRLHVAGAGVQAASVEDLGSTNGTVVNGVKATKGTRIDIKDCSVIEAGEQFFFFTFTQEVPPYTLEELKKKSGHTPRADAPANASASAPNNQQTRRVLRPVRVRMLPLHGVSFQRLDLPKPVSYKVANLSVSGIAFVNDITVAWPEPGARMTGNLVRGNETVSLKLEVARKTAQLVGCTYIDAPASLKNQIDKWFGLEIAASKMADNSANIPTTHDGRRHGTGAAGRDSALQRDSLHRKHRRFGRKSPRRRTGAAAHRTQVTP